MGAFLTDNAPLAEAQRIRGSVSTEKADAIPPAGPAVPVQDAAPSSADLSTTVNEDEVPKTKVRVNIRRKDASKEAQNGLQEEGHQTHHVYVNKMEVKRLEEPPATGIAVGEPNPAASQHHTHHAHFEFQQRTMQSRVEEGADVRDAKDELKERGIGGATHDNNHNEILDTASESDTGLNRMTLKEYLLEYGEEGRRGRKNKKSPGAASIAATDKAGARTTTPAMKIHTTQSLSSMPSPNKVESPVDSTREGAATEGTELSPIPSESGSTQNGLAGMADETKHNVQEVTKRIRKRAAEPGPERGDIDPADLEEIRARAVGDEDEEGVEAEDAAAQVPGNAVEEVRPECPGGMVYSDCGRPCTATCEHLRPVCPAVCVARCHCPHDKPIWDGENCLEEAQCRLKAKADGNQEEGANKMSGKALRGARVG